METINIAKVIGYTYYKRDIKPVNPENGGKWVYIDVLPAVSANSMQSMLIDGSGYYIIDPDNLMNYFVKFS